MAKVLISDLEDTALNWAIAKSLGYKLYKDEILRYVMQGWWISGISKDPNAWVPLDDFSPSTNWARAGQIIEKERISVEALREGDGWCACIGCTPHDFLLWDQKYQADAAYGEGPTPLVAAMRCFVASRNTENFIEIPDCLVEETVAIERPRG